MVVTTMTMNKGKFFSSSSENLHQQCWKRSPVIQHEKSWLQGPLFLKLFGRAGKKSTVTHLYFKCWKKSSAFHCRCHFWRNKPLFTIIAGKNLPLFTVIRIAGNKSVVFTNDHSPDWLTTIAGIHRYFHFWKKYSVIHCLSALLQKCHCYSSLKAWLEEIRHQAPTNPFEEKQEKNWIRGRFCPYVSKVAENLAKARGFLFKSEANPCLITNRSFSDSPWHWSEGGIEKFGLIHGKASQWWK